MAGGWNGVALLASQDWRCAYCCYQWPKGYGLRRLRRLCRDRKPTLDHKTPVARGGTNHRDNHCIACQHCNTRKAILTEAEYRAVMHDNTLRRRAVKTADGLYRTAARMTPRSERDELGK